MASENAQEFEKPTFSIDKLGFSLIKGLFFNSKICRMDIRYFEASACPNLNAYGYPGYETI